MERVSESSSCIHEVKQHNLSEEVNDEGGARVQLCKTSPLLVTVHDDEGES